MFIIQVHNVACYVADVVYLPYTLVCGRSLLRALISQLPQLCPVPLYPQSSSTGGVWSDPMSAMRSVLWLVGFSDDRYVFLFTWCCAPNSCCCSLVTQYYLSPASISLHQLFLGSCRVLDCGPKFTLSWWLCHNMNGTILYIFISIYSVFQDSLSQWNP